MFFFSLILIVLQTEVPLKPSRDFEVITNYELRKKPNMEPARIVFDQPSDKKTVASDMLPFLSLKLIIKKWSPGVTQIKITDSRGAVHLKKKPNDDGIYSFEMGFVDDMKDKVTSGKFFVTFLEDKKPVEQITITVEEDGTFLVNGEKRGKF